MLGDKERCYSEAKKSGGHDVDGVSSVCAVPNNAEEDESRVRRMRLLSSGRIRRAGTLSTQLAVVVFPIGDASLRPLRNT